MMNMLGISPGTVGELVKLAHRSVEALERIAAALEAGSNHDESDPQR